MVDGLVDGEALGDECEGETEGIDHAGANEGALVG